MTALNEQRSHGTFTALLSGYDEAGNTRGPYSGVRIVDTGAHEGNADIGHTLPPTSHPTFAGQFSKGLEHTLWSEGGLVRPQSYRAFEIMLNNIAKDASVRPLGDANALAVIDALSRPEFEVEVEGMKESNRRPFTNVLSGVGAITNTLDSFSITCPHAPAFNGPQAAGEMAELYWMALLRDEVFIDWGAAAKEARERLNELNKTAVFTQHLISTDRAKPEWSLQIDQTTLFRGSAYGVHLGPYLSQFLWRSFRFGTLLVDQVYRPTKAGQDFMTDESGWLAVQSYGSKDGKAPPPASFYEVEGATKRPISNLRDLAHYVHFDALHEAYFNAGLILIDLKAKPNPVSPYARRASNGSRPTKARSLFTQEGFGTFGGPSSLVILSEVATRALKAVWHQKWFVHRRLRPEEMGGRVHAANSASGFETFVHQSLLPGGLAFVPIKKSFDKYRSFLLPMAFEEGCPMHPAYGAGHATVAGACVTVLKAMFDPLQPMHDLFEERIRVNKAMGRHSQGIGDSMYDTVATVATLNGSGGLMEYTGSDAKRLTVEGELNKLAANIAIGRNAAGVHYRSDYAKSMALGEAMAVGLLQELALQVVEVEEDLPVWALPTFDGHWISIDSRGRIDRAHNEPAAFKNRPDIAPFTLNG